MIEHPKYPKIPRFEKLVWSITEKIDGTNGIVHIVPCLPDGTRDGVYLRDAGCVSIVGGPTEGEDFAVFAGSRARWLQPGKQTDNYGFAQWVVDNAAELVSLLGPGTHYGEWWGAGIQRRYDQQEKRFSLFAPWRYPHIPEARDHDAGGCIVSKVPLLDIGSDLVRLDTAVKLWTALLLRDGSIAAPGYPNPEGLVVTIGDKNHKVIINAGDKSLSRDGA
ncbi:MAG: RNA ligase family protein [Coriobacteriia bacterium]|jgi:hypothetical protein|nr:RNA ligase family protein [Coriobacteriia bacterium]